MFAAFLPGMSAFDRSLTFDLNARPTPMGAHKRGLTCSLKPLMFAALLPGMSAIDRSLAFYLNA